MASTVVTTLAGSGATGSADGVGTAATLNFPNAVVTDGTDLFVADTNNHLIRKVDLATSQVSTIAGTGSSGSVDGVGTAASFNRPVWALPDGGGNLYITDSLNNKLRKLVLSTSEVSTLAGSGATGTADGTGTAATFSGPVGLVSDGTDLFLTDQGGHTLRKID